MADGFNNYTVSKTFILIDLRATFVLYLINLKYNLIYSGHIGTTNSDAKSNARKNGRNSGK